MTGDSWNDDAMLLAASDAERANRPRWMVRLGLVLVLGAVVYAGLSWMAFRGAVSGLRSTQAGDFALRGTLAEIGSMSGAPDPDAVVAHDPIPNPQTIMEQQAVMVGLDRPAPPRIGDDRVGGGISRKTFRYTSVASPSAGALLEWLLGVERAIPGMEVRGLDLRPRAGRGAGVAPTGWELDVEFARLEKQS
jgi:hypothetical protein